ncbi:MAG: acetate--CoA ligase [Omnitrophica bacterium RIFCSPHIGHO2_02_FULL_63_14]|nr:MAG: acetate--CoA ligase [Omnitrophica bacterium RIFCSPHIGHO2_02_FULL_63_14]
MSKSTFVQQSSEWVRKPKAVDANLKDYAKACRTFRWKSVEKKFDWYRTKRVNVVHEMVDRHAAGPGKNKVALYYWDPTPTAAFPRGRDERYTFADLQRQSSRFANVLKKFKVRRGDRVAVFLPRTPELYFSFLGINRIGAIPVPLFEAFMHAAVEDRLSDSGAAAIVTTPALRGRIPFEKLPGLKHVFLVDENDLLQEAPLPDGDRAEHRYYPEMNGAHDACEPAPLGLDDGLVIHYTSGSTGKSKGVLHRQYAMVGHYQTAKWALDLREDDVFWCTADPGWVTGTSYGIFGPWTLGISSLVVGGRFSAARWYEAIERFGVTVWYSAPTAFRMLMSEGKHTAGRFNLKSIRHICSVGEPLNPEALRWVRDLTGVAPHETWWMTETGMQLVCNYRSEDFKIGAMGRPFPGTYATVVDDRGREVPPNTLGHLVVRKGWPSMMKTIWNNREKYDAYFKFKGWYLSGDTAYRDEQGLLWFAGREDDVIKTAGERVGPFEVESALVQHPAVAEAGVIGKPDPIKGHIIKAFISLRSGFTPTDQLKKDIADLVKKNMAAHAAPREIEFCERVPKTRSGKIMRRVLRAWDQGEPVGDISTMEE